MQFRVSDDLTLDSRKALVLSKLRTLVLADLFLGGGAARRRRSDSLPGSPTHDLWTRLFSLIEDHKPTRIVLLGDPKPGTGDIGSEDMEEARELIRKLQGPGREVALVRGGRPTPYGDLYGEMGVQVAEQLRLPGYTLMHRRRTFVYPRHEPPGGIWINGGVHPLFVVPTGGELHRLPAFMHTGFALVLPPFVPHAQGFEVMQPDRLPRQAKAWKLLGDRISVLDLASLPPVPESMATLAKPPRKRESPQAPAE